jgi:hypothetical protein
MIMSTNSLVVVIIIVAAAAAAAVFVVAFAVVVERHDRWCYSLTLFRLKVVFLHNPNLLV